MPNFGIITNNPLASNKYPDLAEFLDVSVERIFIRCRSAIHKGAVLISHPLSGSVKPNINPYKSVVISGEKPHTDFKSVQLIEDALITLKKLGDGNRLKYSSGMLEDYMVIDLDLLDSAMAALPAVYY